MNKIVRGLRLVIGRSSRRIEHMEPDMPLDHFRHERIHCASARGNVVQDVRAFGFLVQRPFNGIHLAPDSPYAIQQFLFLFDCVSHKKLFGRLYKDTPPGILWS